MGWGCESWYNLLAFCFFLVKTCKKSCKSYPCKIINIQSFSSQLNETNIDYLLILAKVTRKQCLGAILITDSKMQSASYLSVKCESNSFRVASWDSGNLRVVSYNSTSLWVASCELIIRLWVGSSISLHYIKSALSLYIISSLHVKQSKSNNNALRI